MIVFSALVPSSPFLFPSIGQSATDKLKATLQAYQELSAHLYAAQPDIIVVVSSYKTVEASTFFINQSPHYTGHVKEFGDLEFSFRRKGAIGFAHHWKESLARTSPVQLHTKQDLHHTISIPAEILTKPLPRVKIIPVEVADVSSDLHYQFGKESNSAFASAQQRVAVCVLATLSQKLSPDSPAGFSLAAKTYDTFMMSHIRKLDSEAIRSMDPELVEDAGALSHDGIIWLLGLLEGMNAKSDVLSYESPFGIGYVSAEFISR